MMTPVKLTAMQNKIQHDTTTIKTNCDPLCEKLVALPFAHLDHETDDDDHGHTGHDVCMVLNDELVAEYWQILVGGSLSAFDWGHFRNGTQQLDNYRGLATYGLGTRRDS